MKMADTSETRPPASWFEKRAISLRKEMALALSSECRNEALLSTHFIAYADHLPLPNGNKSLGFNEAVTRKALEAVLLDADPYIVAFLGSKLVERTYFDIFDFDKPDTPCKNLSVAKRFGVFFTPPEIAIQMASWSVGDHPKILDPCCGGGALLASVMLSKLDAQPSLVGIELDPFIAACAQKILARVKLLTNYQGEIEVRCGDGLHELIGFSRGPRSDIHVLINPPYGRLRFTQDSLKNSETALIDADPSRHTTLSNQVERDVDELRKLFPDESGLLEFSRLFFRLCGELVSNGATACIISPDAWLSSRDAGRVRQYLMDKRLIDSIYLIREDKGGFTTVNQALAITRMKKSQSDQFSIHEFQEERVPLLVSFSEMAQRPGCAIPKVPGLAAALFISLRDGLKLKDITWIKNARGELDQTAAKKVFTEVPTTIPLIRGDHVGRFSISHKSSREKPSFVDEIGFEENFGSKPKTQDFLRSRIVGRQCSYAQQARRLIFARVPARHAIGNSCNYLVVDGETLSETSVRELTLLGILNSATLDWYFRVENSNNHVANYEIDHLPLPKSERLFGVIAACVESLEQRGIIGADWRQDLLEAAVAVAFGLNDDDIAVILNAVDDCDVQRVLNYTRHLRSVDLKLPVDVHQGFFNHKEPTLSALDRQIISHVPEGGNWQNIPDSVPSERLKQIREMSAERGVVRTTYYGRLRRDQPAYTINTYFNRPGNGTHIHPVLDRTLTSREAARLQSFPDSFVFSGSEGAIRNQIGNAVPPLLAYAIGKKFLPFAVSGTCVDMFCGAGGLSYGLEQAGWDVVAAVDNDREALNTYALNHMSTMGVSESPSKLTAVLKRDLSDRLSFEQLIGELRSALGERTLDLLAGGPPCQGFSHAGFRELGDTRNDLASIYLHFAEQLRPRIFILENVEGLATFKGGKVLQEICLTLDEFGYRVHQPVWKLHAEQYGVPQMRRRVFVAATLDHSIDLSPPVPTHLKCEGRRAERRDLFEANLPRPFTVQDALAGLSFPEEAVETSLSAWLKR